MKLTLDAVLQHCNGLAYEQQLRQNIQQLKSRLMNLVNEYQIGNIDSKTYSEGEAAILQELSLLAQEINKHKSNNVTASSGMGLGLGLGL